MAASLLNTGRGIDVPFGDEAAEASAAGDDDAKEEDTASEFPAGPADSPSVDSAGFEGGVGDEEVI